MKCLQDGIQVIYWTKSSCTSYTILVSESKSLCFLTEDSTNDVVTVCTCQKRLMSYMNEHPPYIKIETYFSDGCSGQYTNFFNFYNSYQHEKL